MQRQDSHRVTRRGSSALYLQNLWKCRRRISGKHPTPGVSNDRPCNIPQQLYAAYRCTIKFWGDSDTRISGISPNANLLTTRSTPLTRSQRRWPIGLFYPFEFVYTIGTCSGKFLAHATSRFPQGDATREFPLYLQNLR